MQDAAEAAISDLIGLGIEDRTDMDSKFWRDVGSLKSVHRRHEFEPILSAGISQIEFIR